MVQTLDQPAAKSRSTATNGDWQARPLLTRQRDKESYVPESLYEKAEFSRKTAARILDRNGVLSGRYLPTTQYEQMLIADMALSKVRIDRAAELLVSMGDISVGRTARFWHEDQKTRALNLRARLGRDPARMAHALDGFKQGAELKAELWQGLAGVLSAQPDWDDGQRSLALDLLGIAGELRTENSAQLPPAGNTEALSSLAAGEVARLSQKVADELDDRDHDSREEALSGLARDEDARIKRLKRDEAIARRDHQKALNELLRVRKEEAAKKGGVVHSLRPWDVDPLIARIKMIKEPPGLLHEIEMMLGAVPRVAERPLVAKPVEPAVVVQALPAAAPAESTPVPAADPVNVVARSVEAQSESDLECPDAVDSTRLDGQPASTVPISSTPPTPLSRRARKIHQRRLLTAAHREARQKGQ